MGIAKLIADAVGLTRKAADVAAVPTVAEEVKKAVGEALPVQEAAPSADLKALQENKKLLEEKRDEINTKINDTDAQLAKVDIGGMSAAPVQGAKQPQPIVKEESIMEVKKAALPGSEPLPEGEEAKKKDEKKEEGKAAAAAVTPAANPVAPEVTTAAAPEAAPAVEEAPKTTAASFSIRFVQGTSFDNSYFVAEDGKEFLAVKASRIIPVSVQNKIIHALATTKAAPEDVVSPTEMVEQMTAQGVDSLDTFKAAMLTLEQSAKEDTGTTKTAGMMAWNESEVKSAKLPAASDGPLMASMQSEAEAGMKMHPVPTPVGSKVKNYYGRLPNSAGGKATMALNPQSALLMEKIELLRKALEEQRGKADDMAAKAEEATKKADGMAKEKEDGEHSGLMESIVKDLVGKKLIDMKDEQQAISLLAKVERKSLAHVAALLKLLAKGGKDMEMGAPKALPMPGAEAKKPPFGEEKQPRASMSVPPSFLEENESDIASAPGMLSKFWDAR